jgi:hypothetical protein
MPLVINVIDPFDPTFGIVRRSVIDNAHSTKKELKLRLDSFHELEMEITPQSTAWRMFQDPNRKFGVMVETDYLTLPFCQKDPAYEINSQTGIMKIKFASMSYFLQYTKSFPNQIFNGQLSGLLANLNQAFVYTKINTDKTLYNFTVARDLSDFEVLKNATNAYQWRDNGVVQVGNVLKPQILYGKIAEIGSYYRTDPNNRLECKGLTISDELTNNSLDQAVAEIQPIVVGDYITYLDCYSSTSGIDGVNSQININPSNVAQNSDFPLISFVVGGKTVWYIKNNFAPVYPAKYETLKVDATSNTEDSGGNQLVNQSLTPQQIYQEGVDFLRTKKQSIALSQKITSFKRVFLPGNECFVNINRTVEINGVTTSILQLNQPMIFKEGDGVTFDLDVIQN